MIAVGVVGVRHAVRHVRESRAIAALDSEERGHALRELSGMKSLRAMGIPVTVVEGSPENLKITRPGDEAMAERIIEGRRSVGRARG